ncbi:MAG TPA: sugar phosphate nucleotidyltransferase, partial [Acidobacteriota bacterium]|nr:sugar phosphate nucleotidyltransferase [Acidobacteriota bacterium]
AFHEKKADAPTIPNDRDRIYASMGNYVFSTETLQRELCADAVKEESGHDFGKDILPELVHRGKVYAYDFQTNRIPGDPPSVAPYWRDVGTIDSYYEANMDLRDITPALNLYNRQWPLRSTSQPDPPAKFVFDNEGRRGHAVDSIISSGCILSGGLVRNSVLGRGVRVHTGALVENSVLLDQCDIGRGARVRRAILEENACVPEGSTVGYDLGRDRQLHFVSEQGIVVVEGNDSSVEVATLDLRKIVDRRKNKAGANSRDL